MTVVAPDYSGSGLVNLVAELERRLSGSAPMPGLEDDALVEAPGYVLAVFDGLGSHQLSHPAAGPLAAARVGSLRAGFPTTTTTSMATIATGLPPGRHGLIGHLLHLPGIAEVVNVLKWMTPSGTPVSHAYEEVLASPNLWERLAAAGIEPITVQPGSFMDSPLSRLLYRGCRFEPAWTIGELAEATVDVARPGRLVMVYFPNVDVAAHVSGQGSGAYSDALAAAAGTWAELSERLPPEVGLVGTADHGHIDYRPADKVLIRDRRFDRLRFFGDPRSVYVNGPPGLIEQLADETGSKMVERSLLLDWLGPGPHHPEIEERLPDRLVLAPRGTVLLPKPFDKRLIGYHGGLEPEEAEIPLLART